MCQESGDNGKPAGMIDGVRTRKRWEKYGEKYGKKIPRAEKRVRNGALANWKTRRKTRMEGMACRMNRDLA